MSDREQRLFAKLEFLGEGQVARTPIVAATVLRNSWAWNMTILPRRRGQRYPVDFATLLGFSPSPYHPEREIIETLRGDSISLMQQSAFVTRYFGSENPSLISWLPTSRIRDGRKMRRFRRSLFLPSTSSAAPPRPNDQHHFKVTEPASGYRVLLLQASEVPEDPMLRASSQMGWVGATRTLRSQPGS
jgi:hypothetical protein